MSRPITPVRVSDRPSVVALAAGATLDIGCGQRKRDPTWIGIDTLPLDGVDIIGDALEALQTMPTHSVAGIFTAHFMEHIDDVRAYLVEFARVVTPGGRITIVVPHHSNAYYYSDYTHRSAFGLYSLAYFIDDTPFRRKVPIYERPLELSLRKVTLVFKSPPPFYVRYAFRRVIQFVVNASRWTREFYEENLTGLFSVYELRFELVSLDPCTRQAPRHHGHYPPRT